MKRKPFIMVLLYCFFLLAGSVYGLGEKTITLGPSWEAVEKRQGITEASLIRPDPVLVLASTPAGNPPAGYWDVEESTAVTPDLYLSFDEGRPGHFVDSFDHYDVSVSPELTVAAAPLCRTGTGAALFNGTGASPIVLTPRRNALFAPGNHLRDFTIEFWLYPQILENGAQILYWNASKPDQGGYIDQYIQCIVFRNRLQWTFGDFFFSPGEGARKSLVVSGPPVLPRTWSHHLIRFDADLGLLEYLVDGKVEAMEYATASGHEGGEVYTPVIGEKSRLTLGIHFSGMMDDFRIYRRSLEEAALTKYPSGGGRVESRTLDLGNPDSRLIKIEAFGGRSSSTAGRTWNEYAGNAPLRFQDHAEMKFFVRISSSPYRWNDIPWIPVNPGTDLPNTFQGRYIQVAADFYPSEDGETSPYLAELRLIYHAAEAPPPPTQVTAVARDGAVELSWRASPSREPAGYLVYYGTARGEYFGSTAVPSPLDAGNRTSIRIEGLNNGTLYYFAVAAYRGPTAPDGIFVPEPGRQVPEPGEFSREAVARPLRGAH